MNLMRPKENDFCFRCNEDIKNGITNLLMFVKSMKGLAGIRDAVWELLTNESTSHSWDVVCRRLLEKPFLFWEDLMQQLFLDRLQVTWSVTWSICLFWPILV